MTEKKITIKEMDDTPISSYKTNTKTLSSLLEPYGITPKWIYYSLNEKGEKDEICGRKHNWSKNECYNKSVGAIEKDGKSRWCVREYDIRNTPLAFFDDDKRDRSIEETIQEYPFLKDGYYQEGNTKGYHILMTNPEFINAKKVIDEVSKRDLITDIIWCKSDKLYGDKIISVDIMDIKIQFPKFQTGKEQVEKVVKQKTNNDVGEVIIQESKTDKFLEELLDNIKLEYCENFQSWFDIVRALKAINHSDYIDYFSKKCSKYKDEKYDSIVNGITGTNFSIGTIYHYSQLSNDRKHYEILDKYDKNPIKPYEELTDMDFGKIFMNISDEVFYHSTRNIYYGYNQKLKIWDEIDQKDELIPVIQTKLLYYLNTERKNLEKKKYNLPICISNGSCNCPTCVNTPIIEKQLKQLGKNIKVIGGKQKISNVISIIWSYLKSEGLDIDMDINQELFCWNNKSYDMLEKKWIERTKYDFITICAGYDYEEPTTDYKGEIDSIFNDIFPDKEVMNCYLSVLRSGFTSRLDEKFVMANGRGGNGKGLINELAYETLQNYAVYLSSAVLTKNISADKPLPELAMLEGKRLALISENDEEVELKEDSIKKTTNPVIPARKLYSNKTEIRNGATFIAECNKRPKIKGANGNAMLRRLIDVEFPQQYSDKEEEIARGCLRANPYYKDPEFKKSRRIAFFWYVIENAPAKIYEPDVVKERSKKFICDCNTIKSIFYNYFELSSDKNDYITCKDFDEAIKMSDEYSSLDKKEQGKLGKKYQLEFFDTEFRLEFYKNKTINGKTIRSCLMGYRMKPGMEDDGFDSD